MMERTMTALPFEQQPRESGKVGRAVPCAPSSGLKRLIETLPALQHDPNRPEDVLKVDADEEGVGGDDCADCLRYAVSTKAREVRVRKLTGW